MNWSFLFFFNSILLGAGLAMDAFSVSMANGLNDPKMSKKRMLCIAGTFAAFQAFMPMTGWICVHTIVEYFSAFEKFIPWIALILLAYIGKPSHISKEITCTGSHCPPFPQMSAHTIVEYFSAFEKFIPWIALILLAYIGGGMLLNGIRHKDTDEVSHTRLTAWALFIQGVATSIDALSVGFTIAEYDWLMALVCSLIIATVTLIICLSGLVIGKKFGTKLSNKAEMLGGIILIAIGIEIFVSNVL